MKKQLVNLCLFAAAACAATVPGLAQSSQILVKVPFDFTVGSTPMPAGDYSLREDSTGVVFITSQELRKTIGVLTSADTPNQSNETALRFDKVNGRYSLSEVVMFAEPSRRILGIPQNQVTAHGRRAGGTNTSRTLPIASLYQKLMQRPLLFCLSSGSKTTIPPNSLAADSATNGIYG